MFENAEESFHGHAVGVDAADDFLSVKIQHGPGFFFVDFQAFTDHVEIRVVEAVVLEGAPLHARDEIFLFPGREVKNSDDVERVAQHFRLMHVARNAVEHERVGVGMKPSHLFAGVDDLAPQINGRLVWHERSLAGVFDENFSEFAVGTQVAENVAARAMEKIRDGAERAAMRAFAGAGSAKHEDGSVFQDLNLS